MEILHRERGQLGWPSWGNIEGNFIDRPHQENVYKKINVTTFDISETVRICCSKNGRRTVARMDDGLSGKLSGLRSYKTLIFFDKGHRIDLRGTPFIYWKNIFRKGLPEYSPKKGTSPTSQL